MAVAFLVPLSWSGIDRLRVDFADRPDSSSAEIARQSSSADLLLVGWNDATLEDLRIPLLQERLLGTQGEDGIRRGGSPYVASVTTPVDRLRQIIDHGVAPDVAYASLIGSMIGPGKLNVTLTDAGRPAKDDVIRRITDQGREQLGLDLRVSPRSIPYFPEEGDKLFEAVSTQIPEGIPTDHSIEHDFELTWDGIHNSGSVQAIQNLLAGLVGYPTADFPRGVPLVKSAERQAGLPVAVEVRLSSAGLLAPGTAIEEIRQRAADCRIPSTSMLFVGATVAPAAQNQGVMSAISAPIPWGAISVGTAVPAAALLVLTGVLVFGLRSVRRALTAIGVTSIVLLLTVGGFGVARIPFDVPAAAGFLGGIAASLALLIGASAPASDADLRRRGIRSAALVILVGGGVMIVAPSPSLRCAAVAIVGMTAITFALLESNLLPIPAASDKPVAVEDAMLLLTGPGRWLGRGAFLLVAVAAGGLWFARPSLDLGGQIAQGGDLSGSLRDANDALAGTNLLETRIQFDRSAQDRLRFLERMELIRGIESDLRTIPGVTGVFSAADLYPSRTLAGDASTRERVAFNRLSRSMEESFRETASGDIASLVSLGASTDAEGPVDETWTIRVQADAASGLDGLLKQLGTVIPTRIRLEPGVHHRIDGTPLAHAAQVRGIRLSLIVMLTASFAAATAVVAILLADLLTALAVSVPAYLCQAAVLGVFAVTGKPLTLLAILSCGVAALLSLAASTRIVHSARLRMRGSEDATTALGTAAAESSRSLISWMVSLATVAVTAAVLAPASLGDIGFVTAAGLAVGLVGTLVIVPSLTVGRLERIAPPKSDEGRELQPAAWAAPLRRTA